MAKPVVKANEWNITNPYIFFFSRGRVIIIRKKNVLTITLLCVMGLWSEMWYNVFFCVTNTSFKLPSDFVSKFLLYLAMWPINGKGRTCPVENWLSRFSSQVISKKCTGLKIMKNVPVQMLRWKTCILGYACGPKSENVARYGTVDFFLDGPTQCPSFSQNKTNPHFIL